MPIQQQFTVGDRVRPKSLPVFSIGGAAGLFHTIADDEPHVVDGAIISQHTCISSIVTLQGINAAFDARNFEKVD